MILVYCFFFQAKFKLTLEVPSDLVALSNMPVVKETVSGPTKTVYYEESPLMSTYLVAIVVGLFDYIESSTSEGTRFFFLRYLFFLCQFLSNCCLNVLLSLLLHFNQTVYLIRDQSSCVYSSWQD
jgi:hypothetical protein